MKKTTVLLFLTLLCSSVFAQRYSTSSNINFSAGYLENGYVLSLGYEKKLSEKSSLNFDLNYMERKQDGKNTNLNAKRNSYYLSGK